MKLGDTFLNSGNGAALRHFWMVISDPSVDAERVVIANLSTLRGNRGEDSACVLRPDDHEWIVHDSYVAYAHVQVLPYKKLDELLASGQIQLHEPLDKEVLARVQNGLHVSEHSPQGAQACLRKQQNAAATTRRSRPTNQPGVG